MDLKNNDILLKMKEQMVQDIKVEVKDIDINKQIKEVRIEINTDNKNLHNDIDKGIVMNKINYNKYNQEAKKSQRMQIWYVNLGKKNGSVQGGMRPCLISSNSINNQFATIRNVFPITSQDKNNIPVHVSIEGYGLEEKSTILTEQITTIDVRYDLMYYVGTIDELLMKKVDNARNIQLGDMVEKTPLERLSQNIQNVINDKLEDIRSIERTICTIINPDEYLKSNLYGQRECYLASLERICKKYNLDYHDYYTMYKREKEDDKIVI